LAVVAGFLWAASFPKIGIAGVGWLAPGLILATALEAGGGGAFRLGFVAGLVHYLASLYWLLLIPVKFAPILAWLALSAYCALYPATWAWLCWKFYPKGAIRAAPPPQGTLPAMAEEFMRTRASQRLVWAITCAAAWVAGEIMLGRFLTGFPWNFLGVSQYQMLPIIQIASITGVYGVSFLMTWTSVSFLCAAMATLRPAVRRTAWSVELSLPGLAVVTTLAFGMRTLFQPLPNGPTVKLALIQPSIPQTMIWDPADSRQRFQQLVALSEQALAKKPDVLIWPEAAVPSLFRWDTNIYQPVIDLVRRHKVWLIMGADDAEAASDGSARVSYFNSSFLLSPTGEIVANYRKRRLVIFGEYVPLQRWLPFLKFFTPIEGGFTPGTKPIPFVLPELRVKTSVLICFEDIFPHLVREHVDPDTDFLVNLTNNGWFGEGAAQWQHAAGAVFRAVENGLPLVRCSNNGLTCWVDPRGRLNEVYFPGSTNIYQAGFKIIDVPILAGQTRAATVYGRWGDWFGWGCVLLTIATLGWRAVAVRSKPAPAIPDKESLTGS
jgi:apolipoprotein N-acyltransferase